MKKKAAVSKAESKFHNYVNWVHDAGIDYEVLDWEENNFDKIKDCSSLLLTGGADVFPEFYADWEDGKDRSKYFPGRDGFEFRLVDYAFQNGIPVLAICRGMQLINCRLNGTLINDIETVRGVNHRKIAETEDRMHEVNVLGDTLLGDVIGLSSGTINSSHHQSVDRVGEGLRISAKSPDGIVEAVEWADRDSKPFMLSVQWHPERLKAGTKEFAINLIKRFKEETLNA